MDGLDSHGRHLARPIEDSNWKAEPNAQLISVSWIFFFTFGWKIQIFLLVNRKTQSFVQTRYPYIFSYMSWQSRSPLSYDDSEVWL